MFYTHLHLQRPATPNNKVGYRFPAGHFGVVRKAGDYYPMAVMAVVPFVSVLADSLNSISGLAGAGAILVLVIALPLYFVVASIPLWAAAKVAVSGDTTFGTALKVLIRQFLVGLLIGVVGFMMAMLVGAAGGRNGIQSVRILIWIVTFLVGIMITAKVYSIGALHAFGLQLLSILFAAIIGCLVFFGFAAVVGMAGAMAPLHASVQKINQVGDQGSLSALTASLPFGQSQEPPPPPDYSTEIDGLLNAALHPAGAKPSLAEREDMVRTLQQRLQAQRGSLPESDTRAVNVYKNQLNRYLLLLDQVKAERKTHPLGETTANPQAAR